MAINPGDRVRVIREFIVGRDDGWRLIADDLDRTAVAVEGAKVEILERAYVTPRVGDPFVKGLPRGTVLAANNSNTKAFRTSDAWVNDLGDDMSEDGESADTGWNPDVWKIAYLPEGVK